MRLKGPKRELAQRSYRRTEIERKREVKRNYQLSCPNAGPVLRFREQSKFLGGKDFCFYYMFKSNFSEHNKIRGTKNWEKCP